MTSQISHSALNFLDKNVSLKDSIFQRLHAPEMWFSPPIAENIYEFFEVIKFSPWKTPLNSHIENHCKIYWDHIYLSLIRL